MQDAVIVSAARTPIGRAYRGAFNDLEGPTLASHAIRAAVERAGVEPGEPDDVISEDELTEIAARYRALAGFDPVALNERPSFDVVVGD